MNRRVHELKTDASTFFSIVSGAKTFDVRFNDRDYQVYDILLLRCWIPERNDYSSVPDISRIVIYILTSNDHAGIMPGYVVLGLRPI